MQQKQEKIVIFPKWKSYLEKSGMEALEQKNYKKALNDFNQLLSFQVLHHKIILGKLICLMELGYTEEAQQLCEEKMNEANVHYYEYLQIYVTLLFQTDQYEAVLEQIELERNSKQLPEDMEDYFRQLYQLSEHMNNDIIVEKSNFYADELKSAIEEKNEKKQWQLIQQLRKLHYPPSDELVEILSTKNVHPVVKTAIFLWLQDIEYNKAVEIHKLDRQDIFYPNNVLHIKDNHTYKEILLLMNNLEQQNPTLYNMIEQLLYRYTFVLHPFSFREHETNELADALLYLAETYLNIQSKRSKMHTEEIIDCMEEIKLYNALYLSIIEE
ncbi:tetratricopeptide repeat protein [Virgibacillus sp. W0181]|uniref:tetratricopeptide repeat protein n=1 Tax=Virgibacillus sp. W0181 TaxID=3391581 RepID=UPI003F45BC21